MLTSSVVLKEDDLQFISDQSGDVRENDNSGFGLYLQDTRFLNRFELFINGQRPLFLSNSVNKHYIATFQAINPDLLLNSGRQVAQQTLSIRRSRFVSVNGLYERVGVLNCNHFPVDVQVELALDADFRDIFSVRGFATQRVAGRIAIEFGNDNLVFSYSGRDALLRSTVCSFSHAAEATSPRTVRFNVRLQPHQAESLVFHIRPVIGEAVSASSNYDDELDKLVQSYRDWDASSTRITSDNALFDRELLRASRYDIRTLLERTPFGLIPDAGIPWYAVPFGRDAIITALQTLMYNPAIAEGTLRFLAAHQGTTVDVAREEEPGKIMHELRRGELARLGEVPHTPYFGTVDATPLFVVLFVEAMAWLDSDALFADLLPAVQRAIEWIDVYGDSDGDGYVEYATHRNGGVQNQGWKDSTDAVQYDDGTNARQPIALVEVQGYVYHAKTGLAALLRRRGFVQRAGQLEEESEALKDRINRDFWMPEEETFALALDAAKQQVRSVTSNAGHLLWSGACDDSKAALMVRRLLAPDLFTGWGIRTLSMDSPNYNPMSYHNGSVWPHDTALIALGMRRYGFDAEAVAVVEALVEAGLRFSDARLPELFCGFGRDQRFDSSPAAYLRSCIPQAWAAGCTFMLLHCMLGLEPVDSNGSLAVLPLLPAMFDRITLDNMRFRGERFAVHVERHGDGVQAQIVPAQQATSPAHGS